MIRDHYYRLYRITRCFWPEHGKRWLIVAAPRPRTHARGRRVLEFPLATGLSWGGPHSHTVAEARQIIDDLHLRWEVNH